MPNRRSLRRSADSPRSKRVRRLSGAEIAAYDLVPARIARRAILVRVPVLPPGAAGMTSGRFVLLAADEPEDGSSQLIAHELVHVEQFAAHGRVKFGLRYFAAYARNLVRYRSHQAAYRNIPFEHHAYARAGHWAHKRRPV